MDKYSNLLEEIWIMFKWLSQPLRLNNFPILSKKKSNFALIVPILSWLCSKLPNFGRKYKKVPNIRGWQKVGIPVSVGH
jgi:hypothetical protein